MSGLLHLVAVVLTAVLLAAPARVAQPDADLPRGVIVDDVVSGDDAAQSYALYLPSDYTPDRAWSLLLAFHAGARGRAMVEKYRAAAERYGYVVAGSNTSRNGPADVSAAAVRAMSRDAGRRFTIDAARVYLTGMSGGARVALGVALGPNDIAGVIASSAGFPDARPRKSVRFPIVATTGTDDFNYLEMRTLDRQLTSPHRLVVFDGGHTLPPDDVALEAIEWLELHAMQTGRRAPDPALVEARFEKRRRVRDAGGDAAETWRLTHALVADFTGLRDVAAEATRAAALAADPAVKTALAHDRAALAAEARALDEALGIESRVRDAETRAASLARLDAMFAQWSREAGAATATPARSRARRLLAAVAAGAAERVADEEYRALVQRYRWRG
jgi:poly(3-hydroxybutyrate) depolymerase